MLKSRLRTLGGRGACAERDWVGDGYGWQVGMWFLGGRGEVTEVGRVGWRGGLGQAALGRAPHRDAGRPGRHQCAAVAGARRVVDDTAEPSHRRGLVPRGQPNVPGLPVQRLLPFPPSPSPFLDFIGLNFSLSANTSPKGFVNSSFAVFQSNYPSWDQLGDD